MNDLYLIGNGFDLAHGLKTSYNDFLLWYLEDVIGRAELGKFSDELVEVDGSNSHFFFESQGTISKLLRYAEAKDIKLGYKNEFLKRIVENYRDYRWVDIEYEYYMMLVKYYKEIELNPQSKEYGLKAVMRLNYCFDAIKEKLIEYLRLIDNQDIKENSRIKSLLYEGTGTEGDLNGEKLFLYFNYTSTLNLYTEHHFAYEYNSIYIHGKLGELLDHIIFGYGDEMDPHYEKMEHLNTNEFLRNIKSFSYFKTSNYQNFISFIESHDFTVKILGHSCGLSDRILLNTVFEHPNCKAIKIYYYEKSESENDYYEKTQEISRHFNGSKKGEMRKKIVTLNNSVPLIPYCKVY